MLRKKLRNLYVVFGALSVLITLAFAGLQTDFARGKIQAKMIALAKEKNITLSFSQLEGTLPFCMRIKDLKVQWDEGELIGFKEASYQISLLKLLIGTVQGSFSGDVESLAALKQSCQIKGNFTLKASEFEAKIETTPLQVQGEILSPLSALVQATKKAGAWHGKILFTTQN